MVISCPDTGSAVAVRVTAVVAPSVMVAAEKAKVTAAASSLSVNVMVTAELSESEPLVAVPGAIVIVSSASSELSSTPVKVTVPVVAPAGIFNCGWS